MAYFAPPGAGGKYAVHALTMAVIAYHRDYLDDHVHPNNILRHSSVWNDDILFQDKVVIKYPWEATEDTPAITGLPPDIVLLAKVEAMKLEVTALKDQLEASFRETLINQLDQREVGGSSFARGTEIVEKLDAGEKVVILNIQNMKFSGQRFVMGRYGHNVCCIGHKNGRLIFADSNRPCRKSMDISLLRAGYDAIKATEDASDLLDARQRVMRTHPTHISEMFWITKQAALKMFNVRRSKRRRS